MTKHFFTIVLLLATTLAFGANRTFVRSYTYQASESDSKISARANALTEVKRLLLEELGVYMESYVNYTIEEENLQITKDFFTNEIKQLSVGITETKILEETWNGEQYYVKAEIIADPTEVARTINKVLEKRKADVVIDSLRQLLSATSQNAVIQTKEIEELTTALALQTTTNKTQSEKIFNLTRQLSELREKLAEAKQEEIRITSEIDEIRHNLQVLTDKAVANARIGMTSDEVIRLCGQPKTIDKHYNFFWYNYGYLWLGFEHDILIMGLPLEGNIGFSPSQAIMTEKNLITR